MTITKKNLKDTTNNHFQIEKNVLEFDMGFGRVARLSKWCYLYPNLLEYSLWSNMSKIINIISSGSV